MVVLYHNGSFAGRLLKVNSESELCELHRATLFLALRYKHTKQERNASTP